METSDILRKIGGHVVFAESQSGAFRTVTPQSILRIMHYAIPQIINIYHVPRSADHIHEPELEFLTLVYSLIKF